MELTLMTLQKYIFFSKRQENEEKLLRNCEKKRNFVV